jgi:hypothetical protein
MLKSVIPFILLIVGYSLSAQTTWYSYQSGDWQSGNSWTLDPSGTVKNNPSSGFPSGASDVAIILNGNEITINNNGITISSIQIKDGGVLNTSETTGHTFTTISGKGKIKLAADNFPSGDASAFNAAGEGSVEYVMPAVAANYELASARTFNNLIINAGTNIIVLKANYILNGNLQLTSGTLQINDATTDGFTNNTTPLTLNVNGNITLTTAGKISVGNVDASTQVGTEIFTFHRIDLKGNLTNNGEIHSSNLSATTITNGDNLTKYPTAADPDNGGVIPATEFGVIEWYFTNTSANQTVVLNNTSDFYRIAIQKGNSQTYQVSFDASSTANFRLLGRIALSQSSDLSNTPNLDNYRALGLEGGTLKLGNNISIIAGIKGDDNANTQGGNRNYIIDEDAQLWLSSNSVITQTDQFGIHVMGKLKVSDNATLNFSGNGQRTVFLDDKGAYEQTGGVVSIMQFRGKTGSSGLTRGTFVMTGGVLNVGTGNASNGYAIFSLPWRDQGFVLNASDPANPPTMNITLENQRGKAQTAIQIGVKDGNYNVGPSTINIIHTSDMDYKIVSTVPFYNLIMNTAAGQEIILDNVPDSNGNFLGAGGIDPGDNSASITSPAENALPLIVLNDLTITGGRFNANNYNVNIGNILTISDGAAYNPGTNTTTFDGTSSIQYLYLNGTTPLVGGGFYNLSFTATGTEKQFGGTLGTVSILNDLTVGSGVVLDDNGKTLQVNGDISHSGTHQTLFSAPGQISVTGGAASHEIGGNGSGIFHNLTINDATNAITFTANQQIDSVLRLNAGILDIDTYKLIINSSATNPIQDDTGGVANFDATKYIRTAGNASDGGILLLVVVDRDDYLFPIGTDQESGLNKYTKVDMSVAGTSGANNGFIQLRVADKVLPTMDPAETNKLSYYWRVSYSGFSSPTSVSYRMYYNNEDIIGNENQYNGGYVYDESPFTRVEEDANDDDRNSNELVFNGTSNGGAFPGNRFTLVNANFSAAGSNAWNGDPEIYYTAQGTGTGFRDWNSAPTWSTVGHYSTVNAGDYPQGGDIAIIGFDTDGRTVDNSQASHWIEIPNVLNGLSVAQVIFSGDSALNNLGNYIQRASSFYPQLLIRSGVANLDVGVMRGLGTLTVELDCSTCNSDPDVSVAQTANIAGDLDDFLNAIDQSDLNGQAFGLSRFDFELIFGNNFSVKLPTIFPENYPNVMVKGGNGTNRTLIFQEDLVIKGGLFIRQGAIVRLNTGTLGDIEVLKDLDFTINAGADKLQFPSTGTARTLTVNEDIVMRDGDGDGIEVLNTTPSGLAHRLRLGGNIIQGTGNTIDLFTNNTGGNNVILEVFGTQNASYTHNNNPMELYRLEVNKGTSQTPQFTFTNSFTLNGLSNAVTKNLGLSNGSLLLDNSGIDIDVNSGGGDFKIPATTSLVINQGIVRLSATGTGVGNGIELNGRIAINGGSLVLNGGAGANNYISYGIGGGSQVELTAGNLVVGSHFRRSIYSESGAVSYVQSGGTAVFGVNAAPNTARGVFEIVSSGISSSAFELSGAGTVFAVVSSQAAPEQGTFLIADNVNVTISPDTYIDFGYNGTVAGVTVQNPLNERFYINSSASLPNLRVDNSNYNQPTLELFIKPLTVTKNLEILNGGTVDANGISLTINEGFVNNGTYTPGGNVTTFDGVSQTITGITSTTFYDLIASASTDLSLAQSITVANDLSIVEGSLSTDVNSLNLKGDLSLSTTINSLTGGGLIFNGLVSQVINLPSISATIDRMTLDNSQGVTLSDNVGTAVTLSMDDVLTLDNGVLMIGDNRLIFDANATVTTSSAFDATRMISVNGAKKSDGVEKAFPAGTNLAAFTLPIGTPDTYTPVVLDVDGSDDAGSILVKPINLIHPSATGTDVLDYYWVVTTSPSSITNFTGSIAFIYVESDASGAGKNEDDPSTGWGINGAYKAARLQAPTWFKPPSAVVDTTNNTFTFTNTDLSSGTTTTFDGEYTLGNDLPDKLSTFRSKTNSIWANTASWEIDRDGDGVYDEVTDDAPLNQFPQPGSLVEIATGTAITMNAPGDNNQNLFNVSLIGTLNVSDTDGHNFGDIAGTGKLVTTTGTIPAGNYDAFFALTGGHLELSGAGNYTVSPEFADGINALTISGGGTKTLPIMTVRVGSGGLTVNDGAQLSATVNTNQLEVAGNVQVNNGTIAIGATGSGLIGSNLTLTAGLISSTGAPINLSGNLLLNGGTLTPGGADINLEGNFTRGATATFNNNSGKVIFDGTTNQSINGDFSSNPFYDLTLSKSAGQLSLASGANVAVNNVLTLNQGVVTTTGATLRLTKGVGSVNRSAGYVNGPLQVDLSDGNIFSFPVGKSGAYKPMRVAIKNASQSANPLTWEVEYYTGAASGFSSGSNSGIDMASIETNANPDEQVLTMNNTEYWRVDTGAETATASTITVDIAGLGISQNNIDDQLLQVMVWNQGNTNWQHLGGVSFGSPTSGNVVSSVELGFSEKIITSASEESNSVLPVELIYFKGEMEENNVRLTWATASEINNDYFQLSRSRDGYDFEVIGTVSGNDNSSGIIDYEFIDPSPYFGVTFYQLKQVDYDGIFEIFKLIAVNNTSIMEGIEVLVFPNPSSSEKIHFELLSGDENSAIHIQIFDTSGKSYFKTTISPNIYSKQYEIIPDSGMKSGMFFLTVIQGNNKKTSKLLIN